MKKKKEEFESATLAQRQEVEEAIQHAELDKLKNFVMSMLINDNFTKSIYHQFTLSVYRSKKARALSLKSYCHVRPKLSFRYVDLLTLSESYMMDYVEELIEAADRNDGPHATREIMLIAATIKGTEKHPYITPNGLLPRDKVFVNFILRLAGYEVKSKFVSDVKQSRKVWTKAHGFKNWTKEERATEVRFQVAQCLRTTEENVQSNCSTLDDII